MTILNVWTAADRALVAVDTLGQGAAGQRYEVSKLLPLPHANCVVSGRGSINVMGGIYQQMQHIAADFDGYIDLLPQLLTNAMAYYNAQAAGAGVTPINAQEICIVGWSPKQQRMVNHLVKTDDSGSLSETRWCMLSPSEDTPEFNAFAAHMETQSGMLDVARKQIEWAKRFGLERQFGGRLIIAELTRDEMRVRSMGEL